MDTNKISATKAFTLAEMLITLTIIGVIAALTIPNLMKNYQNHVYVVELKRAMNNLQTYIDRLKMGTNCLGEDLSCTYTNSINSKEFADSLYKGYIKKLGFPYVTLPKAKQITGEDAWAYFWHIGSYNELYLMPDGMLYSSVFDDRYRFLTVDINGFKAPNQWGRDKFWLEITKEGKVTPVMTRSNCRASTTPGGGDWPAYCASYWISTHGWEMDY